MMCLVASREMMRYSSCMTELNPVEYAASAAPLVPLTAWLWAWISDKDFGKLLRGQLVAARRLAWFPLGVMLALIHAVLATLRPVGKGILWLGWAWMELWRVKPIAEMLYDWLEEVRDQEYRLTYVGTRRAY